MDLANSKDWQVNGLFGVVPKSHTATSQTSFSMTAFPDYYFFNLTCRRDPLPKPGRGSPCEGAHRGETEPAGQRSRDTVLHLAIL